MLGSFRINILFCLLFCQHFADAQSAIADGQLIQTCTTEM